MDKEKFKKSLTTNVPETEVDGDFKASLRKTTSEGYTKIKSFIK